MTAPDPVGASAVHDVVVLGAGVVGCAVARELSRTALDVVLLDERDDVGDATTKANTAILHTGFDATPGTLESRLVRRGYELLSRYAEQAGIPLEPLGALVVAWDDEQVAALPALQEKARANGYDATELLDAEQLRAREPRLGPGALAAVHVPGEGIVCPWTTPLAFATEAVRNGVQLQLSTRALGVEPAEGHHVLRTDRGDLRARWVINTAGLGSAEVDGWFGHDRFRIIPRRGQLIVFDKLSRSLVRHIVLPVPTSRGKGVLVAPTVYGNVMLGPTAEDLDDPDDTSSTREGLDGLRAKGRRILPELLEEEVTTVYAGLRAATEHGDYQVHCHADQRYVCVGGIRSTGLTSSLALAEHVRELLEQAGVALAPRPGAVPVPRMPNIGEARPRPYQRADLVAGDPEYGSVVCHCERVTRGEVRDALASDIPPASVEGLRRRTRVLMGRCQGFFCGAEVRSLLETSSERPQRATPP